MKIGILTWFFGMNYGAQAQTYALAHHLEKKGHTCELIAYYGKNYRFKNLKMNLKIEEQWYKNPRQILFSFRRMKQFENFIKEHKTSPKIRQVSSIDKLNYDIILIGSDELINCIHPFHDSLYFGVGIERTPTAYYAPSSGALQTDYALSEEIQSSLSRFVALSGRDEHACQFLRYNTKEKRVCQVVDPTLLYDFSNLLIPLPYRDYVLIYSFDAMDAYAERIREYAKESNLQVLALGRFCSWADQSFPYANEREWLSLLANSHTVVTDSFHGLIFSVKFHKEFVLVGRDDKLNKNNDFLQELGISRRYLAQGQQIASYLNESIIDTDAVYKVLEQKIFESENYIDTILEKIK